MYFWMLRIVRLPEKRKQPKTPWCYMDSENLYSWDLTYKQAVEAQRRLAEKVDLRPLHSAIRRICGLDCAFIDGGKRIIACAVVLIWPDLAVIESENAVCDVKFPYIPGLLSFREGPACVEAISKLQTPVDLFIADGQGTAHPRRFGLACHLGVFLDRPFIGCAKSRLTGRFQMPASEKGSMSELFDRDDHIIGMVVRTRSAVKPVYVSAGHKCSQEDAAAWVLRCATKYRLPEPTGQAHKIVSALKKELIKTQISGDINS